MAGVKDFAACLVRDFMVKHKLVNALKGLELDLVEAESTAGSSAGALEAWYQLSRAIDFPAMEQVVAAHGAPVSNQSNVEVCVEYLCRARAARANLKGGQQPTQPMHPQQGRSSILAAAGRGVGLGPSAAHGGRVQPGVAGATERQHGLSQGAVRTEAEQQAAIKNKSRSKGGKCVDSVLAFEEECDELDEMSLLDQALAMEHAVEKDLYSIALEVPLNEGRFMTNNGDVTRRQNVPHGVRYGDGMTNARPRGGVREPTADPEGSSSVSELAKRLERSAQQSSPTKRIGQRFEGNALQSRSSIAPHDASRAHVDGEGKADNAKEPSRRKRDSAAVSKSASGPLVLWKEDRRQKEHPATYSTTMKIMARDLRVGIINAEHQVKLEREREREAKRLSPAEQVQLQEKYGGKRLKQCGLCEKVFSAVNLPLNISFKAVIDVRRSWGVPIKPNSSLTRVPRCYDQVRVCQFCSQFFESVERYRPQAPSEKSEDEMLLEFQKSIEHLDPRDESAFFRKS